MKMKSHRLRDDPTLPVWTFRMWFLGLVSCSLLSFLNQFFAYRSQPLIITQITVQVATLPLGNLMAAVLPSTTFNIPGFGSKRFSLNPGPFNMKEHVLVAIFANAGSAFGSGSPYAVGIVNIIKAFYGRSISFLAAWLLIITTQVLGYGWAGLLKKYLVEPAHTWWPSTLIQVSIFRTLHEKDEDPHKFSRAKFFFIALVCSFLWYIVPGYLFTALTSISWVCWVFSKSVTAQQLAYWGFNVYDANKFSIFSSDLFTADGQLYIISAIVNDKFQIDLAKYQEQGQIHLSVFFSLTYGFGFATIASTITHVVCFHGREIMERYWASKNGKEDIHTRLMKNYKDILSWWFYLLLGVTLVVSLLICIFLNHEIQMPWWGLLFASALAFMFALPISIITATTNQVN
ncbi:oligopeptide transporter 4 [Lathyrus oleraceus]|uniref:Oligopeptide transporter 4 n=1 Tax=Pisum sativum TaxID=3888 RepID=A0A9D4VLX2_PEA|nr:oligopeptide transporter 4 [Pisum sativum]